jgi:hypothetical protein
VIDEYLDTAFKKKKKKKKNIFSVPDYFKWWKFYRHIWFNAANLIQFQTQKAAENWLKKIDIDNKINYTNF